ncbi:MAG: glycosyltransferase family 25 protein [Neisseriaceae bacterium]|nr:glycosyltransferase family 25 protein [Neisseriaceae bacterium]
MKLFIINLEEQTHKRQLVQAQLTRLGLDAEFIPAVNGKALPLNQLKTLAADYDNSGLTAGEIGCALSHIAIYQKMIDEGIDQALILEDDVILSGDLLAVLRAMDERNPTGPMAYLLTPPTHYNAAAPTMIWAGYKAYDFIGAWGTYGYIINQAAAKNLLDTLTPVFLEADNWAYFQDAGLLKVKCIQPALVHNNDVSGANSSIASDRLPAQNKRKQYYQNVIKKNRPFNVRLKKALWNIFKKPFIKIVKPSNQPL